MQVFLCSFALYDPNRKTDGKKSIPIEQIFDTLANSFSKKGTTLFF